MKITINKFINLIKLMILVCITGILISGCGKKVREITGPFIFYKNMREYSLIMVESTTSLKENDCNQNIKLLFNEMKKQPDQSNNEDYTKVIPDNVILTDYKINDGVLYMFLTGGYDEMSNVDAAFFRMAVVNVMTQLEEISYVYLYHDNEPVKNIYGEPMGMLDPKSFISEENSYNDIIWISTNLYFSGSTGKNLVVEKTNIAYSKNTHIEQIVMEYLLNGPEESGNLATIPTGTKLLGVQTKDGTCYVNFSSEFISSRSEVSAEVTIYSIVNSLCELYNIKNVQFQVNGDSDYTFGDSFSLREVYERNLNLTDN